MAVHKIIVSGARSITDNDKVFKVLKDNLPGICDPDNTLLITGGAKGVDQCVAELAQELGYAHLKFRPYFTVDKGTEFNPRHYFMRNKQMVEECDRALIIHDGEDTGTKDLISRMERSGKPFVVVSV